MKYSAGSVAVGLLLLGFVMTGVSLGQAGSTIATGAQKFGSFGGGPFDVINLGNLDTHFDIPVIQKAGRGSPYTFTLSYDNSIWYPVTSSGSQTWAVVPNFGWNFVPPPTTVGRVTSQLITSHTQPCNPPGDMTPVYVEIYGNFVYYDSQAGTHPFSFYTSNYTRGSDCPPVLAENPPNNNSGTATDGSGLTLNITATTAQRVVGTNGWVVYAPSGSTSMTTDANGNEVTTSGGVVTDTLGYPALTITGTNPYHLQYPAPNGGTAQYTLNYSSYNIKTNFGCSTVIDTTTSGLLLNSIVLPDSTSYQFSYEATVGSAGYTTGRISSITLPTGGTITYAYSGGVNDSLYNAILCSDGTTPTLTRTLSPGGQWTYSHQNTSGQWMTTVTSPPDPVNTGSASDVTVINFAKDGSTGPIIKNFYETQRKVYQGPATGTPLLTATTCYNLNYASCASSSVSSPITQTDQYSQYGSGSARLSETTYDATYGILTGRKDYDYGVSLGSAPSSSFLMRSIAIAFGSYSGTCTSLGNSISGAPCSVSTYNSAGQLVSKTVYSYDETGVVSPVVSTPQHTSISGSRGNLTTIGTQTSSAGAMLYRRFTYYDTGMLKTATDWGTTTAGGANITTYNYATGPPSPSCGNSFVTSVSEPLSLSQSYTWNCAGGVMLTSTDENGKVVTSDYSTDPDFWRPDYIQDQLLNKTNLTYSTTPAAVESTLTFNGGNSVSDILSTLDNLGRPQLTQRKQSPTATTYDSVQTFYDVMGRVGDTMLPYAGTAGVVCSGSCPKKVFAYDALNRPTKITDSGSGTVSYSYIANDVLQTVGPTQTFVKQMEYDGLGRLTSVCEVTAGTTAWPGGTCGQTNPQTGYLTKYTYDALGNLLTVKQNAQTASNNQTRKYTYDMLSRLTSEVNPETGNSSTGSDVAYTYDVACGGSYAASAGDLTKRVDKAGSITCYGYDALHRLKDSGNTGPTCRHFRYDTQTPPSGITVTNNLARKTEAYTDNCISGKLTDEWFGYDADGQLTDFYESTPHSGGYYHTSASYWANGALDSLSALTASSTAIFPTIYYGASTGTGLDGEGRVTKVSAASGTNPVTNVTYVTSGTTEPIGAITGVTLGSGDTDSLTFDPNTGRPLTYAYSVNSVNDNGTLIWNANGTLKTLTVADSLAGTNDSQTCNYYYDDLARLGGKNTNGYSVDCGTKWQQLFTFDPFGNISKSGTGTFAPTYSTATNQFTAIPGIVSPYYDANGNLTKDNLNTYAWDPNWGNPTSINSTGLIYDAEGQMVEQQNGSTYAQMLYSPTGKTAIMNGQTLNKAFVSLPGGGTAIYNSTGLAFYRHADWLGSSRLTSTASRTVYSASDYAPFGEQYGTSGTPDASFTGQDADTTSSLYDFTFREHTPSQGRWTSPDPAGLVVADLTAPQTWNRYAYVMNSPLGLVDPLGFGGCVPGQLNYTYDCQTPPWAPPSGCQYIVNEQGMWLGTFCPNPTNQCDYGLCNQPPPTPPSGPTGGGNTGGGTPGGPTNNNTQPTQQKCLDNYNNSAEGKATKFFSLYNAAMHFRDVWKEWTLFPGIKIAAATTLKSIGEGVGTTEFLSVTGGTSSVVTGPTALGIGATEAVAGPVTTFAIGGATVVDMAVHVQCAVDPGLPPDGIPIAPK